MPDKIHFYLLILCGILSQRIIGTVGDEIEESSNFLLRQKRVVNRVPSEDKAMSINGVPYTVAIRQNGRIWCVGSILSHHVVITVPGCIQYNLWEYQVISGTTRSDRSLAPHNITNILKKFRVPRSPRRTDGIVLLTVNPPFVYSANTSFIPLHSEPLLQGTLGIVSGWGHNNRCNNRGTKIPTMLRAIQVPIIPHQDCVNIYRPHNIQITDANICTYHPLQNCGHTDGGAPLAVNGHLAGIHLWTGPIEDVHDSQYPAVFALLQDSGYYQWIMTKIREIEAQFQNDHN